MGLKKIIRHCFAYVRKTDTRQGNIYTKGILKSVCHPGSQIHVKNACSLILNSGARGVEPFQGMLEMLNNSIITVSGDFSIYSGMHIIMLENAKLNLGSGYINRHVKIRCYSEICIGENVAISENVTIWDSDAHIIVGKESEATKPIKIGNNVWIGNNVTILKGVKIGDGAVIAAGALVNKDIPEKCLAGGVPAKVLKEDVEWK